jgi:peptidoglycan/xylan/chitin deacetylase (PgdA/CDA1 family)
MRAGSRGRIFKGAFFLSVLFSALSFLHGLSWAYVAGKFYYQAHSKERVIALTFDDGPGVFTPQILDLLKEHHIRATFFMLGDQVPMYPAYAKQVLEAGHELGNHTYTHTNFNTAKTANRDKFVKELDDTEAEIFKATGQHSHIVRMPYGAFGKYNRAWLLPTLKEKGYALVHWSFGTDWFLKKTPEQMAQEYIHNAFPGAVFLFHDGGRHREKTLAALKIVIPALEQKGYRFVAAEDLFSSSSAVSSGGATELKP